MASSALLDTTGSLTLTVGATGGNLNLAGQVTVSGATSLTNTGLGGISAANPSNNFNNFVAVSSSNDSAVVVLVDADSVCWTRLS